MSAEAEHDQAPLPTGDEWEPADEGDSLENALLRGIPADARLDSGVPEGQRANALDFIQMSGLTRPPARTGAAPDLDLNPVAPLSFYEAGVADVDEEASLDALSSGPRDLTLDANLTPDPGGETLGVDSEASEQAFQAIIDALEAGRARAPEPDATIAADVEDALQPEADPATAAHPEVEELANDPEAPGAEAAAFTAPDESVRAPRPDAWRTTPQAVGPPAKDSVAVPDSDPDDGGVEIPPPAAAPAEDDFEDFLEDAVIQAAPAVESAPESAPRAGDDGEPVEYSPPLRAPHREALQKAEQLMSTLGKQPAAETPAWAEALPAVQPEPNPFTPPAVNDSGGEAESYSKAHARRRSRRHSRLARRMWRTLRLTAGLAAVTALAAGAWFFVLAPRLLRTEDHAAQAARLMDDQRYAEAAAAYEQVASRGGPSRADALFHAAQAAMLSVGEDTPADVARPRLEQALAFFSDFAGEFPQHPKRARALALTGRVHFEAQDYDAAIAVLRDQVLPADDPAAALMVLRYLARAYRMKGAYDEAETAYLQAATLPDNYSAEIDYRELGDMYRTRAGLAETDAEARRGFEETAARYWSRALQAPGIDPAAVEGLQERLEWQAFTGGPDTASPDGEASTDGRAGPPAIEPPAAAQGATESAGATAQVAEDTASPVERLEDPAAELEAWTRDDDAAADAPQSLE